MPTNPMQRLMRAALAIALLTTPAGLHAQASGGKAPGAGRAEVRGRTMQRHEAELTEELARQQVQRTKLVKRIEELADQLQEESLGSAERRRLEVELEQHVERLAELHTPFAVAVGSRMMLERKPSVATTEVRRVLGEAQRRLTNAARTGYMGITLSPTNNTQRVKESGELFVRYFEHPSIISVEPNSPAERAGLQRGDFVLAYNGLDVRNELPMHQLLEPGNRVTVRVRRDGREHDVDLMVATSPTIVMGRRADFLVPSASGVARVAPAARAGAREPYLLEPSRAPAPGSVYRFELTRGVAGAELDAITGGLSRALGVKHGLLVMSIAPRSLAANAGLQEGDIILEANGTVVKDIAALSRVMREADGERAVKLGTQRDGRKRVVTLRW